MKINSINIKNYRNIGEMNLNFGDTNIIWGENAQGKTNLLEAIYLFTGEKSFRGAKDKELIMFGKEFASMNIEFNNNNRDQSAEIVIKNKRTATLNGIKKKSAGSLGDEIKAVIFSPVHLNMIKGGPEERRSFVDTALCQLNSNYRLLLKEYNKTLKQRNTLLKSLDGNLTLTPETEIYLDVWNKNLTKTGSKIVFQRQKYIEAITPYISEIFCGISDGKEKITAEYFSKAGYIPNMTAEEIENTMMLSLTGHKTADIVNKTTTVGPHRDDIEIKINGISAKTYASQGQQRSCVLALKLAEARLLSKKTGVSPVILLDDVMSELDEKRQDYILNNIKDRQIFVTCCDKNTILRLKSGKTFHISNGKAEEN
ncbi:MAG: DNA replication/repair protein RecF [Oscillospiraceae bacterium]|nr:DNA replication/repair protein RecF [Oscillospiraceae bacterium]